MPIRKLRDYLDQHGVKYVVISHSSAFTAQEIAASAHIPGREIAKTVIIKLDGKWAMAVLPASVRIDFGLLKEATGTKHVEMAGEREFRDLFPDCDVGAMPPFGNLYNMPVYVAEELTRDAEIAFNACSHTELIRLAYEDYKRLTNPTILDFSKREAAVG
jgi:Ala-tRNA(Pro) deacylase